MSDPASLTYLRINSLLILVLGIFAIWSRHRSRSLLTAVSGLHLNVVIFCGLGPLCFSLSESQDERIVLEYLTDLMVETSRVFLAAYLLSLIVGAAQTRWSQRPAAFPTHLSAIPLPWMYTVLTVAILGYWGDRLEMGRSGTGTIIPVLKGFVYPAIVLCTARFDSQNSISMILTTLALLLAALFSVYSQWRSQFLMFLGSFGLGVVLKYPKMLIPILPAGMAALLLLIPFQNYKKANFDGTNKSLITAMRNSTDVEWEERAQMLLEFFGTRLNSTREMAYVLNGVKTGILELRHGESYRDALLQMIPRLLWREKPSYNFDTGWELPRVIGLLSYGDDSTSWGVNLFAEFLWNFRLIGLLVFVPLTFSVFRAVDGCARRWFRSPHEVSLLGTALFFQTFQLVGIVNATTYFAWTFIVVYLMGKVLPLAAWPERTAHAET